jgi:NAD(P) transhydrogenase subunit alpha
VSEASTQQQGQGKQKHGFHRAVSSSGWQLQERRTCRSVDVGTNAASCGYDGGGRLPGRVAPMDGFLALYVFMLAAFTGYEIIGRVPVILHTPLMSGSNFVHGIVLVGGMVVLGEADTTFAKTVGFIAVLLGAGNAAGGYVVTERMLEMFKSSKKPEAKA